MSTRKFVGSFATLLVAGAMVIGGAVGAHATTVYPPEGGTWNHGVRSGGIYGSGGQVYSEYAHSTKTHSSRACGYGGCTASGWVTPGVTSIAHHSPMASSNNTAQYNTK